MGRQTTIISILLLTGFSRPGTAAPLEEALQPLLGTPYRDDGARNRQGHWVTFRAPQKVLSGPGLNCSGFLVEVARRTGRTVSLQQATADRENNSGPGAALGEDWDFGRDLILNLAGQVRAVLHPKGRLPGWPAGHPATARGFNMHDAAAWQKVLPQIRQDRIYFASISKPWHRKKGYRLLHYHVAALLRDHRGEVWFYHTTRLNDTHRMNLSHPRGLTRLLYQFRKFRWGDRYILIVEADRGAAAP